MKRFILRGVLDYFSSTNPPSKSDTVVDETLRSDHFNVSKTVRHGFPYEPTAVAFDPVQHILAIGNKTGSLRIIGRPGVDIHILHEGQVAILQVLFLINEGTLVTVCSDDTLHLWNFKQKKPEIVNSLKFQRERITRCHLPFQSKWLYIGTERGNVHIVNIESFILSGYVINWNRAIHISQKTHPGPVLHLSDNPVDSNKLLIGFESGVIVMWDLRSKSAEYRYHSTEVLRSITWHFEGKQFMCSHSDGTLTTWNVKTPHRPANIVMPHAKIAADGKLYPCKPISKVAWNSVRNGEDMVIFSGGMSYERVEHTPSITVMMGKSTTVLKMKHDVIDFVVLCDSPWCHDFQDPYAVVVLLQSELVVVDLTTPGYPCFENHYPMDLHESPVTACQYYANCPTDLVPAFYSVGSKQKKTGYSGKAWPIKGGQWGTTAVSYPEIIITGHADGSLKFWDASSVSLQILYKLKTAKIFEKPQQSVDSQDDDPFAIQIIFLCPESRLLCVAGASHVTLFRFCKQDLSFEVSSLELSIMFETFEELDSPDFEGPTLAKPSLAVAAQHSSSMGSHSSSTSDNAKMSELMTAVKVRGGTRKWAAGYQPDLVCVLSLVDGEPPGSVTVISLNSSYGLMAFGNDSGLAIVDFVQKTCLLNLGTPDLYGSVDPYQRVPRSPRSKKSPWESFNPVLDDAKSPTADPLTCVQSTISKTPPPIPPRPKHKRAKEVRSSEETSVAKGPDSQSCETRTLELTLAFEEVTDEGAFATETVQPQTCAVQTDGLDSPLPRAAALEVGKPGLRSERPPSPLLLTAANCVSASQKCVSTGSVNLESLQTKPSVCETVSDQAGQGGRERGEGKLPIRRSLSDPSVTEGQQCKAEASPQVAQLCEKTGTKKLKGKKEEASEASPEAQKTAQAQLSGLEATEEAIFVEVPVEKDLGAQDALDGSQADLKSPELSDAPHSRSFFRRMSLKLKSSFSGKLRQDWGEELGGKSWRERARLLRERKVEVIDLSDDSHQKRPSVRRMNLAEIYSARKMDRNDGSSRSRSSSISSVDNMTKEAIQCLVFADSYTKKTDSLTCPCLWVGTSLGSVIVICLNVPGLSGEQRAQQPVTVSPTGTVYHLRGGIVGMAFLGCSGILVQSVSDHWKDSTSSLGGRGNSASNLLSCAQEKDSSSLSDDRALKTPSQLSVPTKVSPTASQEMPDQQFVIICSEKQARVVSLPSQTCAYKVKITETSFVVRAEIVSFRDSVCLMCYIANGHIMAFSLPSLKPLYDEDFFPLTDYRVARSFCFSHSGHALYLCSPTEIQKITYSADIADNMKDMVGDLFLPCDMPEAPKQSFFKNLFGGGISSLDREELFGEASGKASRSVAKHIPGAGGMQHLQQQAEGVGGEFGRARLLVAERGERLGELDDSSSRMMSQAENFAQTANQLMTKYRDKKWYQF